MVDFEKTLIKNIEFNFENLNWYNKINLKMQKTLIFMFTIFPFITIDDRNNLFDKIEDY